MTLRRKHMLTVVRAVPISFNTYTSTRRKDPPNREPISLVGFLFLISIDFFSYSGRNNGNNNQTTTTMTVEPVLCAERAQPIPTNEKAYMITVGQSDVEHPLSEAVYLRFPASKRRLFRPLESGERGISIFETEWNGDVLVKGKLICSILGSLAEISAPRLWEKHFNN